MAYIVVDPGSFGNRREVRLELAVGRLLWAVRLIGFVVHKKSSFA